MKKLVVIRYAQYDVQRTGTVGIIRMNKDEKVCRSLRYMNELLSMEALQDRYSMTDCRLCIIQEREQVLESEEYIAD